MAVKKFTHSCAGYSVATYVLGIGDRHNDNIMVTTSGNLFHIDFGHFLGNIKYYMGFKREWAPFVLTPDFVYVMGGEEGGMFETYKNLCCRAFLTLRRNADLIINLFSLMRSTGIPELTCVEDTDYIRNALVLDKTEQEAEQLFRKVIRKCLDLKWTVQMMWKIHLLRKKGTP
ncbi:Phosphatidylinositol 4,5-bisphosphate 3-kinase catalytic subunit gamma isoform [Geodia barretti]|nr:Phosphatidylinositol 4,5-bisphosphate 3-kinase catalytic subunit gamma isoform [Geodia barretti]